MVPIHLPCCQHPLPFSLLTDLLPVSLRPPRPRTTGLVNHSSGFSKPSTTVILQNLSFLPPCLLLPKSGESELFLYLLLRCCSAPWSRYLRSPAPRASRGGYQNHTQIVTAKATSCLATKQEACSGQFFSSNLLLVSSLYLQNFQLSQSFVLPTGAVSLLFRYFRMETAALLCH